MTYKILGLDVIDIIIVALISLVLTILYSRYVDRSEFYKMSLYDDDKPYICCLNFSMKYGPDDFICGYTNMKEENLHHFGINLFRTSYVLKLMPFVYIKGMLLMVVDKDGKVLKFIDMNNVEDITISFRNNPRCKKNNFC